MADEMKLVVDAQQILVKLHFAALQATRGSTGNGQFFVNTGIENDDPKGVPEKIGDTKFNLDNKTRSYQAGYVTDFTYTKSFKLENAITDIFKLRAELYSEDKALLDKNSSEDPEKQKRFSQYSEMINDALKTAGKSEFDEKDFQDEKKLTEIRDIINNVVKTDKNVMSKLSTRAEELKKKKEEVMNILEQYMNVFAGADNVTNWKADNVADIQVSNYVKGPNDKALVKDFSIQLITEKEREALDANFRAKAVKSKDGNAECTEKICFFVEYILSVNE